jgi:hypothetical protein
MMLRSRIEMALAVLLLGCTGSVGNRSGAGSGNDPSDGTGATNGAGAARGGGQGGSGHAGGSGGSGGNTGTAADAPGPTQLRRLTNFEYRNTVRDLLGMAAPSGDFNSDLDSYQSGFARGAAITKGTDARLFLDASDSAATAAAAGLTTLLPCKGAPTAAADQESCIKQFITDFGLRAYRRPLDADESGDLYTLYSKQRMLGASFTEAVQALLVGILQSPFFLYRWELNQAPIRDGALIKFGPYEIASRLSYTFWSTMPDDALFRAAAANQLSTPDQISTQARRMMADPKFKDTLRSFSLQWLNSEDVLGMQKDPALTNFTPAVAQAMVDETAEFANHLLFGPDATGKLDDLFTSNVSYVDAALGKVYGASVTGPGLQKTTLDGSQRAGILTQASFLAAHSNPESDHPVRRGVEILRHVLCTDIEIPKDITVPPVAPLPDQTTRETFAAHSTDPKCSSCHALIDPLGFAFEHYDAIGQWRTTDNKKPVDSTGKADIDGLSLNFKDAVELSQQLAKADPVRDCMGAEWLRYMARRHEGDGDAASLQAGREAFSKAGFDLRELMLALTRTRSFTHRSPSAGEVF